MYVWESFKGGTLSIAKLIEERGLTLGQKSWYHHCIVPCCIALAIKDLRPLQFQKHDIVCDRLSLCSHAVMLSRIFSLCLPLLRFEWHYKLIEKSCLRTYQMNESVYIQKVSCKTLILTRLPSFPSFPSIPLAPSRP